MRNHPLLDRPISIHTLTQRVTRHPGIQLGRLRHFNPHPHAEGDGDDGAPYHELHDFNPHPHAEGDKAGERFMQGLIEFQSTPSRRG